jgi:hypothetical protein
MTNMVTKGLEAIEGMLGVSVQPTHEGALQIYDRLDRMQKDMNRTLRGRYGLTQKVNENRLEQKRNKRKLWWTVNKEYRNQIKFRNNKLVREERKLCSNISPLLNLETLAYVCKRELQSLSRESYREIEKQNYEEFLIEHYTVGSNLAGYFIARDDRQKIEMTRDLPETANYRTVLTAFLPKIREEYNQFMEEPATYSKRKAEQAVMDSLELLRELRKEGVIPPRRRRLV